MDEQEGVAVTAGRFARSAQSVERHFEALLFGSRWLAAPIYLGLVFALIMLLVVFVRQLYKYVWSLPYLDLHEAVPMVLSFIDIALVANLVLIVILAGYEHFVSKIDTANDEDRPDWMGTVDFAGLKLKLFASIIALTGIELLKAFMDLRIGSAADNDGLLWLVAIHVTFLFTALLSSLADWLSYRVDSAQTSKPSGS